MQTMHVLFYSYRFYWSVYGWPYTRSDQELECRVQPNSSCVSSGLACLHNIWNWETNHLELSRLSNEIWTFIPYKPVMPFTSQRQSVQTQIRCHNMSQVVRKPAFCICENKDADQLRGNRKADQRLCFRYIDSTIPLLPKSKFQASSHLMWLPSLICVEPGRKPRRPVFSQRGSYGVSDQSMHCLLLGVSNKSL